jgi:hypothetical protein
MENKNNTRITDEDGKILTSCKKCRHSSQCVGSPHPPCRYESGIALHYVFHLGKHKGKTVAQVIHEDPQYLLWMTANVKWFELSAIARGTLVSSTEGYDKRMYDAEVRRETKFGKGGDDGQDV